MITPKEPPWYKPDPAKPKVSYTPYSKAGDFFLRRTKSSHGMGAYISLCRYDGSVVGERLCDGWPESLIILLAQDLTKNNVSETISHILYLMQRLP